jgi:hypothetical protein
MTYLSLDDGFGEHPKIAALSHQAFRLHLVALLYCSRNLTDGRVDDVGVRVAAATAGVRPGRYVRELEAAGLWEREPAGYCIHDYLKHNLSASEIKQRREHARNAAKARWRDAPGNARSNAPGNAQGNALPPSPLPMDLSMNPSLATNGGERDLNLTIQGGEPFDKLHRAVGGSREALTKLRRTWPKPTDAACIAALEACTGPNVHDRLAVAITELKKRRP